MKRLNYALCRQKWRFDTRYCFRPVGRCRCSSLLRYSHGRVELELSRYIGFTLVWSDCCGVRALDDEEGYQII